MKRNVLCLCVLLLCAPVHVALAEEEVNYLDLASLMLRDGNLERALRALDQFDPSEEDADLLRYHTLRGMTHLRREEPEAAAASLEQAAVLPEAESLVFVYLAQAYFTMERYSEVLDALDRARPALDRVASIYHMRAQCHWLLEEHALALGTLDQADTIFPTDATFLRRKVFFLMDLGLYREAAEAGRAYLARSEGKREDFIALGNAMRASGETDEAIRLLEEARLQFPGDTDVNKVLAHAYIQREQMNAAAGLVYEAALLDASLVGEAAEVYRRAGQLNRALMLNGQVADQSAKLKQRLALLLELQRYESAAAMAPDLRRIGLLEDQDIRYALAYAVFKSGDFESAEAHLQQLTRPDLFRKAAELRRAMSDCSGDSWQCL